MKYLPAFALFFAGAFAQQIHFSYPKDSSMIPLGETVVSINQPASPTSNENLILVLSVAPCPHGTCPYPYDQLGRTLYSGPFNPQYPKFGTSDDQPQQNFTVTIPDDLAGKQVQLSAVSLSLNGAGPTPLLQIKNITVYVSYS